jgi:hypothetical protein
MKRASASILALLMVATLTFAAQEVATDEDTKNAADLKTAQVVAVKNYDRGRIVRWEGRVPIFDDYPFYDISLLLDSKKYVVRYESMTGYYPSAWKPGSEIRVRLKGKGRMYLLNGSEEVVVGIFNNKAQQCVFPNSPPITLTVGPQVPCQ